MVARQVVQLEHISTDQMIADPMTKTLPETNLLRIHVVWDYAIFE